MSIKGYTTKKFQKREHAPSVEAIVYAPCPRRKKNNVLTAKAQRPQRND